MFKVDKSRFVKLAWYVLVYNLLVIVWGAFVRASVSGDGCGPHWPLCNGEIIPTLKQVKTGIEFAHRVSSGLVLPMTLALLWWALRLYPKGHPARTGAKLSVFFTCTEALLGMVLVKYKWVAHNDSIARAVAMSAHLINTFLLLAAITLTAWWAKDGKPLRLKGQGTVGLALLFGLLGTVLLAVSGAVTALGDTLFPAGSLIEGIRQDISPTAHILVRLRLLHPLIAMSVGLYLILIAGLLSHLRPSIETRRFARWMGVVFLVELSAGLLNLALLAPIPMQLLHLLLADLTWINLILLTSAALAEGVPQVEAAGGMTLEPGLELGATTWRDYLVLTKPRVISLLLFTTLAAMFIAKPVWPGLGLFLAVAIGGYMAAGAANAINMVIDRDIDGLMRRTTERPTVTRKISSRHALLFAFALASGSFALLWWQANLLTAMLAFAGLVVYVVVYTLFLKRRTWQNIVIGGAAGAFPPLVGWAAVDGKLSFLAWCLFGIIFVWTPVHFWALALLLKEDYASAGVPMLPVVHGERATILQIGLYAIVTVAVSALPLMQGQAHGVYLGAAALLNGFLLLRCLQLYRSPDRRHASALFHYSMVYLALLFLTMAVDRAIHL